MSRPFDLLFSPIRIGSLRLANRIVMASHSAGFSTDPHESSPGDQLAEYMARRAAGGAALVCLGSMYSSANAYNAGGGKLGFKIGNMIFNWDMGHRDTAAEASFRQYMSRVASRVHEAGGRVFALLDMSPSRTNYGYSRISQVDYLALSASQTSDPISAVTARELEADELREWVRAAGEIAAVIAETGIDGIELHAHAGFLHSQFLSPATNFRTDAYGGSIANRMRFTLETLQEIRNRVAVGYPLTLRLSPQEDCEGGLALEEGVQIAQRFEETRLVDMISVTVAPVTKGLVTPDMSHPPGLWANVAAAVRGAMQYATPVLCVGRIEGPQLAQDILAAGQADLIGMVRPLIADPDLPRKSQQGRLSEIRPCTFANEGCLGLITSTLVKQVTCTVNPEAGHERAYRMPLPVERTKKLVVVGGGPAGLKAAEQARLRGHHVVLFEKDHRLGGQVALQSCVASRRREAVVIEYLAARAASLGVEVRLNVHATHHLVMAERPDAVILAIGSYPTRTEYTNLVPHLPGLPGADQPFVLTGADVLRGAQVGESVLVIEDSSGGDLRAALVVEYMLSRGHKVLLLTTAASVGHQTNMVVREPMLRRLYSKGMAIRPHTGVRRIGNCSLVAYNVYSGIEEEIDGFDTVVLELGYRTTRTLFRSLKETVAELYEVGDAVLPRSVTAAVLEGFQTGRRI